MADKKNCTIIRRGDEHRYTVANIDCENNTLVLYGDFDQEKKTFVKHMQLSLDRCDCLLLKKENIKIVEVYENTLILP